MKLLLTGDLHLGRASTRLPADAAEGYATSLVWRTIVDYAVAESIDVVLISGDLIDESNKRWEARGPVETGLTKLAQAGIETLLVSGNHDHDVLPHMITQFNQAGVRLLGAGGTWERHTVKRDGRDALHVDGFSFPARHYLESPLEGYDLPNDPSVPTLGLVHGEIDNQASRYAPLATAELKTRPLSGWLLGHIHASVLQAGNGGPWILYPGSPQPLDPGETGLHGVWVCEIDHGHMSPPHHVPLSAVRYDSLAIDVTGVHDTVELEGRLTGEVRAAAREFAVESGQHLQALSLRVTVGGESSLGPYLEAEAERIVNDMILTESGLTVGVDKLINAIRPPLDLTSLSEGNSATATLARLVLELESGNLGPAASGLLDRIERDVDQKLTRSEFTPLGRGGDDDTTVLPPRESVRDLALRQARLLLTQLVEQTA